MKSSRFRIPAFSVALLLTVVLPLAGCGGGGDSKAESSGGKSASNGKSGSSKKSRGSSEETPADAKRKFLEDIPYDVFFDEPLTVAARTGGIPTPGPSDGTGNDNPPTEPPDDNPPGPTPTAGAADWKSLIDAQTLEDEISSISNTLKANLQSVGSYNTSYLTIPVEASTIAALALVAEQHSGDVGWKENAKMMATLASQIAVAADGPGKKKMDGAVVPFESIGTIIAGSKPAAPPDVTDSASFSDLADFGNLMKRFERTEKWFVSNTGTEAALKENADHAYREASVLAALAKVLAAEGYGFHGDKAFEGYVQNMIEAAQKMKAGAKEGNHPTFDEGINLMRKSCTECHGEYRG